MDSWAGTVDLSVPLGRYVDFTGAFYRGKALGGYGGGIGQTVLFFGNFANPLAAVRGLNSMGGWSQLKFKPTTRFEINAAFGQDNPFASDLRSAAFVPSQYEERYSRNQSWFGNFIYQVRSNVLVSAEFRRIKTTELDGENYLANQVNLALGYIF